MVFGESSVLEYQEEVGYNPCLGRGPKSRGGLKAVGRVLLWFGRSTPLRSQPLCLVSRADVRPVLGDMAGAVPRAHSVQPSRLQVRPGRRAGAQGERPGDSRGCCLEPGDAGFDPDTGPCS